MAGPNSPFGSSSVSSLLKSSQTAAAKIQALTDAQIAFDWSQSGKSADDFATYSQYLNQRMNDSGDPSDVLSLQKTLSSAQSGYISNEIQRQSQAVMEGDQDNTTKYNNIQSLYYQALNSGNYDSAQSIRGTLDSLSVTIQNEQETKAAAAQSLASKLSGQANTDLKNQVSDAVTESMGYIKDLGTALSSMGEKEFAKQYKTYAKDLGLPADAGFFDIVASIAAHSVSIYDDALQVATDPTTQREFQTARNALATGDVFSLPGANGKSINVSMEDLEKQIKVARTGQTLFRSVQTGDGVVFQKNQDTGYVYGRDEKGNYELIPLENPSYKYADKTKQTLENAGFLTQGGNDGPISILYDPNSIKDPELKRLFEASGLEAGSFANVYVGKDGQLQINNGKQSFNLAVDDTGKAYGLYEQTPNPITLLNDRFSSDFLSTLNPSSLNAGTIGVIDDNPMSQAFRANQPGSILGQALQTQIQLQKSAAQAKLAASLGAPSAAPTTLQNANVNPMSALNANITLAKQTASAAIKVVAPPPAPNIKVNNTATNQTVKVNNQANNQTIKV